MTNSRWQALVPRYLTGLVVCVLLLGLADGLWKGVFAGGIYWFDLDRERNLPSWFSGLLFFLVGLAALLAYFRERAYHRGIKLRWMWVGVALIMFALSLDEITVLHENILWREIRVWAVGRGDWAYFLTQWQLLFAPWILFAFLFLALFLRTRLGSDREPERPTGPRQIRGWVLGGLSMWAGALALESVRSWTQALGAAWYQASVVMEESAEMLGAILLLGAVLRYLRRIGPDPTETVLDPPVPRVSVAPTIAAVVGAFALISTTAILAAWDRAAESSQPPRLVEQALKDRDPWLKRAREALQSRPETPWFDDLRFRQPLLPEQAREVAESFRRWLWEEDSGEVAVELNSDREPRVFFLSYRLAGNPPRVLVGSGSGANAAIEDLRGQLDQVEPTPGLIRWAKIDVVRTVHAWSTHQSTLSGDGTRSAFAPSLEGVAFPRESRIALLPEELSTHQLVGRGRNLAKAQVRNYLSRGNPYLRPGAENDRFLSQPAFSFNSNSFLLLPDSVQELYRGHPVFGELDGALLTDAAIQGGEYLIRAVDTEGRFRYRYQAAEDQVDADYNILRHSGTLLSMLQLYQVTSEPRLLEAAERGLKFLEQTIHRPTPDEERLVVVEKGFIKLGGNALAVIAMAEHIAATGNPKYSETALRLGLSLAENLSPEGIFRTHKESFPDGSATDFRSEYYPGEAILALLRLHRLDSNGPWLELAGRAARQVIQSRASTITADLPHDHWLLYGLAELDELEPRPEYVAHALRLTKSILVSQNRQPLYRDWLGSYNSPPRSTPTATRTEGLLAGYRLLRSRRFPHPPEDLLLAIELGLRFQLQTRLEPATALYLEVPDPGLGGFRRSLTSFEIRIDYVQHNISSLLGYLELFGAPREREEVIS